MWRATNVLHGDLPLLGYATGKARRCQLTNRMEMRINGRHSRVRSDFQRSATWFAFSSGRPGQLLAARVNAKLEKSPRERRDFEMRQDVLDLP